ncbi:GTP 3',8-cyclase MoaA [Paucibacter sp. KCTC 42545]|uniref:GTP 3',8-cyclase MoaA n=1 Tax=Paucibacter sp. KCTC 42545 TaxID=1768242 RepID=UPI000733C553|nr:GTP 3',8-cyclase MoaA [Paucibacter sp. KCTC 42545]ALT77795.1 cyclic pyranopterin phosphate synthase MoaA [Paucibacter sp. KCTC 42545]
MTTRVVFPIADQRQLNALPTVLDTPAMPWAGGAVLDALGRPLRDLRISVTDRCNFRCSYCMPKDVFDKNHVFLPHADLLSFEEITRLARVFAQLGVQKLRLTGGEPLLRRHIENLIEMLATIRTPEGQPLDLTLTTNGSLLKKKAQSLKDAGLQRITVSLDGLDDAQFQRMNDVGFPVAEVLEGIAAAQAVGLAPIKVNMVVKRGSNDDQILPMARHFRGSGITLRFIEYMDVGSSNGWQMDEVLPSAQVLARLQEEFELNPLDPSSSGETAERWAYADGAGEIGLISSVTQAFCGDCNRARLSTEGKLYNCLFAHRGADLRGLLRGGSASSDELLGGAIAQLWSARSDRYSQLRASGQAQASAQAGERRVEMHYIGG